MFSKVSTPICASSISSKPIYPRGLKQTIGRSVINPGLDLWKFRLFSFGIIPNKIAQDQQKKIFNFERSQPAVIDLAYV